jgi:hypothetical protein
MDAHFAALNALDVNALACTLHFPHYRMSGTRLKVWDNHAHYLDDFLQRAGDDWGYSRCNDIRVVHSSDNKVHLDLEIQRFRHDHTLLTRFRSLWVITCEQGIWAAKFRSSLASQ